MPLDSASSQLNHSGLSPHLSLGLSSLVSNGQHPPPTNTSQAFLVAQSVKNLPAVQETQVQSLGQEDLLEKEMANHSSILAWKIPWTEERGRVQSMRLQRVGHD